MRELKRLAWAAAVAAASAAPGFAQMGGGGTGGGIGTAATTGLSSTNNLGGTTGGTGGTTNSSTGGTGTTGGTANATLPQAPSLVRPSQANVTNQAMATSNFLSSYYGAVYYQGSSPNYVPNGLPGKFGTALFPATATGTAGRGGIGGTGAGGRAGAAGGGVNTTDPGGILVPLPRQIAYAAQVRFAVPPAPPTQLLTNLRGEINRAPAIANPAGVQIQVDGQTVTLRGAVRDQDEARLVEGMVRLTPGVGPIVNELSYPGK